MKESEGGDSFPPMARIGDRIRRVRDDKGLTQGELAAALGVHRQAVTNWELGKRPSLENLYQISKIMSVPMEWFMAGDDNSPIPFIEVAAEVARIAAEPSITLDEAASIVTQTLLGMGMRGSADDALFAAKAVIKAFRTVPDPPKLPLSEEEKQQAVFDLVRLFRPE